MAAAGPTVAAKRHAVTDTLRQAGIESPDIDARLLIGHALGLDRTALMINGDRHLRTDEVVAIDALAARRLRHEPVSRILGRKEFWSLPLDVSDAVLVPRPDTETVVEAALDCIARDNLRLAPLRILDIGTGSGALLLALLTELKNGNGVATDISPAAIAVARGNAERLGLSPRCTFVVCDIAGGVTGPFDLIVSNPPYIAHADIAALEPEVRDHDPALALDGGIDGLDAYRAIASQAIHLLAPCGRLIVELGAGQEPAVRDLFSKAGLTVSGVRADLAGIPRALTAC
ncbi:MAG: peptide chain release factor N(5)-glutamine methyltransferase, partial [Hyphomicrobiales bacterium]|nr:peptide chain release factor N(5)-glutamine methyltransferase [Hyphomicrobiales bacterium]